MIAQDPIDAVAFEEPNDTSREVVVRHEPALTVMPQVKATDLVERLDAIREAQHKAMKPGIDYGVIPGTAKPALLKPGAEKLGVLFQLDIQPECRKTWGPGDHLTVECEATVYHAPTGARLGKGEGVCSTREKKYAKRKQERVCPVCDQPAVIKGKDEYGGGWLCWKKRDGCGAKFPDGDVRIEGQQVVEIDNPDLPDLWNTVVKMAEKRARVDAVLAVTGASALFSQDVEDESVDEAPSTQPPIQGFDAIHQELEATCKSIVDAGIWTADERRTNLIAAGAPEKARTLHEAVAAIPRDQADELLSVMLDLFEERDAGANAAAEQQSMGPDA